MNKNYLIYLHSFYVSSPNLRVTNQKQTVEENDLIINKYDLTESQAVRQTSLAEKVLDLFIPAAYAEEILEKTEASGKDQCKFDPTIIFSNMRDGVVVGTVIGGMVGSVPGAISGALSGMVTGSLLGAFNASKELNSCKLANQTEIDFNSTNSVLTLPSCKLNTTHIVANIRDFALVETIANGMSGGNPISGIIPGIVAGGLVGLVNTSVEKNSCEKTITFPDLAVPLVTTETTSDGSICRLNTGLIFSNMRDYTTGGTVIGGMTGSVPGAVIGGLSGTVWGALVGAFQASDEQKKCKKLIGE